MITVSAAVMIAACGLFGGVLVSWGMYQSEVKRLRVEHDKLAEYMMGEIRRIDTRAVSDFEKINTKMDVIIRIEVMQSQLERSLEALHKRQDSFEMWFRRFTPVPHTSTRDKGDK